jgi:O-acetyl-ADP-ribose deacetylase
MLMNDGLFQFRFPGGQRVEITAADITQENVDAIVNAANASLQHGGGVAAAIVRCGGELIQRESDAWVRTHGPVPHSQPAFTQAGSLPCKYVIHAVGPIWGSGDEEHKLAETITGSLRLAESLSLSSIAFPAISTGIFGFPKELAARTFRAALSQYFENYPDSNLNLVRLDLPDTPTRQVFLQVFSIPA